MGSYFTIVNNTEETYERKVGTHKSVLTISLLGATFVSVGVLVAPHLGQVLTEFGADGCASVITPSLLCAILWAGLRYLLPDLLGCN